MEHITQFIHFASAAVAVDSTPAIGLRHHPLRGVIIIIIIIIIINRFA